MMRCGDCKHWKYYGPRENEPPQGKCDSPSFINLNNVVYGRVADLEKADLFRVNCIAPLITGEDFGCVHYESPERP